MGYINEDIQGIILGFAMAVFTFVVNKIYVLCQLYRTKRNYPDEKIIFFHSVNWQGTIFIPFMFGFCIGSSVLPLYQFPEMESIFWMTQYNKHFFFLIFVTAYINWFFDIMHIYIFTNKKIIVRMPDKLKFFMPLWIKSRDILYSDILYVEKYKNGVHLKIKNEDKVLDLKCLNSKKMYQKLQLLLNKEND